MARLALSLALAAASAAPLAARDPLPVAAALDRDIDRALADAKLPASPGCSDAEFVRRLSIDLIGRVPTAERVRAFLADARPDRRARLIDELLASPEYGRHFGAVWFDLLTKEIEYRVGPQVLENWLADQFNKNRPWDAVVRDVLTAKGQLDDNPAAVVWFAHTEAGGKSEAKIKPHDMFGTAAQRFLGQRLQCAECHDHPFTGYKQEEFWAGAAFFAGVEFRDSDRKALRKERAIPTLTPVKAAGTPTIGIPDTKKRVAAKLPGGRSFAGDPRAAFARWCAAPDNPAFSRAMANRAWAHFLGRGFVNPVDDFRDDNPASHPEALKLLADEFVASGFDLKHLARCVVHTRTYQRSAEALPDNSKDESLFSHAATRPMSPNVMYYSFRVATGKNGTRQPEQATQRTKNRAGDDVFARRFKGDDDEEPELAEYAHGVPQVLWLMNGDAFDGGPTVRQAVAGNKTPAAVAEALYLSAFARRPTPAESQRLTAFAARERDPVRGYALAYWAMLNSSEFLCNH